MAFIIHIAICSDNLSAELSFNERNSRVHNELKLLFSNVTDELEYSETSFKLPWFVLRRMLPSFALLRQREKFSIEYNDIAKKLIEEVVSDRKELKERESFVDLTPAQLKERLSLNSFNRELKDEQVRDTLSLLRLKHGANFSVPGAGKTTTILAVHTILRELEIVSTLFVISPINAFISWEDEIREIYDKKRLIILRLTKEHILNPAEIEEIDPDVVLVNYEKLRMDTNSLLRFFHNRKIHLVLDESHRVKSGMNNISYSQIIKLADITKRRDILSGTPMPQSYKDLVPQFDFLWPGGSIIPESHNMIDKERIVETVNGAIEKLFVRTTKNELGLEEPEIAYKKIKMGRIQTELYHLFKSEAARKLAGLDKTNLYDFRRIGRCVMSLLQAATNPMLLTPGDEYSEEVLSIPAHKEFWELLRDFQKYEKPTKITYLQNRVKDIIAENKKNKVLIWSYFVRNITLLERLFKEYNPVTIYGGILTGSDSDEMTREGRIRKFHIDETCRVMIANPQACGEGISLHKVCHHAIYLDRNFNAAYFLQSIDRIHRLGLDKGVKTKIEVLISEDSIDKILINRLNSKIDMMGSVLEDPYLQSLAYDPEDILVDEQSGLDNIDVKEILEHLNVDGK